ncbi:retron Ec67 family RNA-directed DNA polymerase/endonuclease [Comamonas sp. A7-5]|uniref:retron Ec67 family RNA-directed DNA polymerase/endonuclease n=1 Tax=Comamonas sp. A7-5 TaxID=673549 RepID=UPI0031D1CBBE
MSTLKKIQAAKDISDLAKILGYSKQTLAYIVYGLDRESQYKKFKIKKRSGGKREINAPKSKLKLLQRKISFFLYDCLSEISISHNRTNSFSHGFMPDRSIATNAQTHRNKRWILNIDLKDFFPSIHFGRVRGILIKDNAYNLNPNIAQIIAQICCLDDGLPQGAPTSPILSNIVTRPLDLRLTALAKKHKCVYTRYADDITFSTNQKEFPAEIAHIDSSGSTLISKTLKDEINGSGFDVNNQKTRLQSRKDRQSVTGLIVNKRVNVPREYRKYVRAMVDGYIKNDDFSIPRPLEHRSENKQNSEVSSSNVLQGMLGFIDKIDLFSEKNINELNEDQFLLKTNKSYSTKELSSQEKVYKKFLFYEKFYASKTPILILEGKTDNSHIRYATRNLGSKYPDLCFKNSDNTYQPLFRILACEPKRTNAIIGLCGGAPSIGVFAQEYGSVFSNKEKKFSWRTTGRQTMPSIIILDDDDGYKDFKGRYPESKIQEKINDFTYHLKSNLYLIKIHPSTSKKNRAIEDLYPDWVLKHQLNGRTLNLSNQSFDLKKYYGKSDFAEKVIPELYKNIDFSDFETLFNAIRNCIEHWTNQANRFV